MKFDLRTRVLTRRNFFGTVGSGLGALAYMRFGEAEWLEVNQPSVKLRARSTELPPKIRLLHLSDFHASPLVGLDFIQEAVELGASLKPDLICLTGDFITRKYERFADYADILKKLSTAAPTFACMGNHDGGRWIERWGYRDWSLVGDMLKQSDVTLLHNQGQRVELNGKKLQLVGVGDLWALELNVKKAFEAADKNLPTILLSHNPDSKLELGAAPWDLMLSGHTHGGQLKLPILGTPFAPVVDKRYVAGLKPWRDRWIHVTKGVGNLHGLRFNCRPEISLLHVSF
jgi:predicted MPP superfamily phosphohydrolase